MVPLLGNALILVLNGVVTALVPNLASRNTLINTSANTVMDLLTQCIDPIHLLQPFVTNAQYGNARVQPILISKLAGGGEGQLHRNCVEFYLPTGHGRYVTLIDSFEYLEVHVRDASDNACRKACPQIAADIQRGKKEAARRLHYGTLQLKTAFLCSTPSPACRLDHHLATVIDDELVCSVSRRKTGEIQDQHRFRLDVMKENPPLDLDNTPKLQQLRYLRNMAHEIRIIEEIQSEWRKLSDLLQLPDYNVRNLEAELSNERACRTVFLEWLNGEGRGPRNWHTVVEVLRTMNQNTLANRIPLMWN